MSAIEQCCPRTRSVACTKQPQEVEAEEEEGIYRPTRPSLIAHIAYFTLHRTEGNLSPITRLYMTDDLKLQPEMQGKCCKAQQTQIAANTEVWHASTSSNTGETSAEASPVRPEDKPNS